MQVFSLRFQLRSKSTPPQSGQPFCSKDCEAIQACLPVPNTRGPPDTGAFCDADVCVAGCAPLSTPTVLAEGCASSCLKRIWWTDLELQRGQIGVEPSDEKSKRQLSQ
ncbi:MAG TPA: hypothetical protein VGQ00_04440 [Candidatus Norongarragalinales archaeon]|nr:hypothetical protein [Candidatus Norongarragalinales archaeon]